MKQLISKKECLDCKDPCCEFSWAYLNFAPVFTNSEKKKLVKNGFSERNFRKRGNCWQIRLKLQGAKLVCPFIKLVNGKRTCSIQKNKPLDCEMFPFSLVRFGGKIFLGICRKDSACYAAERLIKTKKFENHVKYLKSYLKKIKKNLDKYTELVFPKIPEVEIICEI